MEPFVQFLRTHCLILRCNGAFCAISAHALVLTASLCHSLIVLCDEALFAIYAHAVVLAAPLSHSLLQPSMWWMMIMITASPSTILSLIQCHAALYPGIGSLDSDMPPMQSWGSGKNSRIRGVTDDGVSSEEKQSDYDYPDEPSDVSPGYSGFGGGDDGDDWLGLDNAKGKKKKKKSKKRKIRDDEDESEKKKKKRRHDDDNPPPPAAGTARRKKKVAAAAATGSTKQRSVRKVVSK